MSTPAAPSYYVINFSPSPRLAQGRKDNCILPDDSGDLAAIHAAADRLFEAGKAEFDAEVTKETVRKQLWDMCYDKANNSLISPFGKGRSHFFFLNAGKFGLFLQLASAGDSYADAYKRIVDREIAA